MSTAATSCKYYYVMINRLFVFKMSKKIKNCSSQNPKDFIFSVINDKDKQKILSVMKLNQQMFHTSASKWLKIIEFGH